MNLAKFLRTSFLQNTSARLLLFLAFQKQPPEVLYDKRCSWKFCKIHRKTSLASEIFKNNFFTEHLRTTASAFSFSETATGGVLWKRCSCKLPKIQGKTPLVCEISNTLFLQNTSGRLHLAFSCNFTKMMCEVWWGIHYLETLTLEEPFRYIISFFGRITFSVCLHWFTLFTARSSHQSRGVL